jgi:general L-amino acid transport system substrate-binding protein
MHKRLFAILLAALTLTAAAGSAAANSILESVKKRDFLQCGVNTGLPGFSHADQKGNWTGLDVDICRAVAAAVLGDAGKVKYTPLTAKERLTAVQSGEVDVLSRNTTWTLTRDTALGLNFTGVSYYDGQGFMVTKGLGVKSAKELDGAAVCILAGTTTELNLADYFRSHGMAYQPVVFDTGDQTVKGFEAGRCDVLTSDQSQLYGLRIKLANPESAIVLPEVISKEPLGPVVRQVQHRPLDPIRYGERREAGGDLRQRGRDEGKQQPRDPAPARDRGRPRQGARAVQ